MSDESEPVTAVAKAVEETAKTGRALVEAGSDLASFVGKALGTVPEDTVGLLVGDYLHDLRIRNLDKISRKTEKILRERGVKDPEPIGPKVLLPALEAASEETDETLQGMWAREHFIRRVWTRLAAHLGRLSFVAHSHGFVA